MTADRPKHMGLVAQGFTDPTDEWTAECSCGWRDDAPRPYDEAVAAAEAHAKLENAEPS